MKVIRGHGGQGASLHLNGCLANGRHLGGFALKSVQQPNQVAVANESIAVETEPRHGSHIMERVGGNMMQHVAVQKQPLQRGQIIERPFLDLS